MSMRQISHQFWQILARAIVILCTTAAGLVIWYPNSHLNHPWDSASLSRADMLVIVLLVLSLALTIFSWQYVQRFFLLIASSTVLVWLLQDTSRSVNLIRISLCSLIISLLLWSVIKKAQQNPRARTIMRTLANPWGIVGFVSAIYIMITVRHHLSLNFTGFDLAIFTQEVYKYAHFSGIYNTVKDQPIFADHFSPFLMLLAPLWWVWPSATMLLVMQVLGLCFGGLLAYKIAHEMFHDRLISWCIATAYLLAPSVQAPIATDFHEAIFVPAALLLLFYFQQRQKYVGYWITFVAALLIKEDVALYLIAWSLFYGLITKRWKAAWIGTVISAIYFLIVIKVVMPHFTGTSSYQYFDLGPLGNSPMQALKTIVAHPGMALHQFFAFDASRHPGFPSDIKVFTQISLMAVFGFLPLLAPITLVLAAPMLIEQFLLDFPYHWGLTFHYATPLTPVLVIATLLGLSRIPRLISRFKVRFSIEAHQIQRILALFIAISSLAYCISQRTLIMDIVRPATYHIGSHERQALLLADQIPAHVSVAASVPLLPHVADRNYIISWPGWYGEGGAIGVKNKPLNTDYCLLTYASYHWVWSSEETIAHMDMAIHTPGYGLIDMSDDGWTILVKRGAPSNLELLAKWETIKPTLLSSK